jgi:ABC-type sugar transport system ATPase subunit
MKAERIASEAVLGQQAATMPAGDVFLRMTDISKSYPGVQALANANFEVRRGEVHGLVGKNGAGKSTLMGVLMGISEPDSGKIEIDGKPITDLTPDAMLQGGIAYVPQQVKLLSTLSVAENILVGNLPKNRLGLVSWREVYADAERRLGQLGLKLNVRLRVEGLSVAEQTALAIARALFTSHARLIILDEPTAALPRREIIRLFGFVRALQKQGVSFIYISHHLEEVFEVCDRVTVMRDGRIVDTSDVTALTRTDLIQMMVGETVKEYSRDSTVTPEEVFRIENLSRRGAYEKISLSLKRGEVVGLSGLDGSGAANVAKALFGLERLGVGKVTIGGKPLDAATPRDAFALGVAYLPQDRHRYGLIGLRPVRENITFSVLDRIAIALGIVPSAAERDIAGKYIDQLGIVTPSQEQRAQLLSGGNQQKVVFARLAATRPAVLILHEPTQGIDVRAKVDIFNIINDLSKQGVAVLIVSTEVRELIGMCDRILVMYAGRLTHEFTREKGDMTPENILMAVEGGSNDNN